MAYAGPRGRAGRDRARRQVAARARAHRARAGGRGARHRLRGDPRRPRRRARARRARERAREAPPARLQRAAARTRGSCARSTRASPRSCPPLGPVALVAKLLGIGGGAPAPRAAAGAAGRGQRRGRRGRRCRRHVGRPHRRRLRGGGRERRRSGRGAARSSRRTTATTRRSTAASRRAAATAQAPATAGAPPPPTRAARRRDAEQRLRLRLIPAVTGDEALVAPTVLAPAGGGNGGAAAPVEPSAGSLDPIVPPVGEDAPRDPVGASSGSSTAPPPRRQPADGRAPAGRPGPGSTARDQRGAAQLRLRRRPRRPSAARRTSRAAEPPAPPAASWRTHADSVARIDGLLPQLDHEELLVRRGRRSGLTVMVAVHSTARGPALGGCRMWTYARTPLAVLDVLRLSRAMSYKNAAAGLPLGGGKGVIALPQGTTPHRPRAHRRAARLRRRGRRARRALPDGRGRRHDGAATWRRSRDGTRHVTGLSRSRGGSGDPSPLTALGVEASIETVCARLFGTSSLQRTLDRDRRARPCRRAARGALRARGRAALLLADVDPAKRAVAERARRALDDAWRAR